MFSLSSIIIILLSHKILHLKKGRLLLLHLGRRLSIAGQSGQILSYHRLSILGQNSRVVTTRKHKNIVVTGIFVLRGN